MRLFWKLWAGSLLLPLVGAWLIVMETHARWGWRYAALPLIGACFVAVCWFVAALRAPRFRLGQGAVVLVLAGAGVAFGPALVMLLAPWEDPETGYGSPLAALISVVFACGAGMLWVVPGAVAGSISDGGTRKG